jgi:hypothetical protein
MGELVASISRELAQPITVTANAKASLRWLQRDSPELAEARNFKDAVLSGTESDLWVDSVRKSRRAAANSVFALEMVFLVGATLSALGYSVVSSPHFLRLYAMIAFTAIAIGMRNAAVRKLAVPDTTRACKVTTARRKKREP